VPDAPVGILTMAYGTPNGLDEVLPYYTHIRHGHPPSDEQLRELMGRYEAIGGRSPLREITQAEGDGLVAVLRRRHPGQAFAGYQGMKHTQPYLPDAVDIMHRDGIERAVALVLAPHYSAGSIDEYRRAVLGRAAEIGGPSRIAFVESWHLEPSLIDFLAARVVCALTRFDPDERATVPLIVSAHSLPARLVEERGDPYAQQLTETARALAARLGRRHWRISWQSAGRTSERWLGPDILDTLRQVRAEGHTTALVCPAGFVSDHLEVLYDLDIEAQALARDIGLHLERTASPNAHPAFLDVLADVVDGRLNQVGGA
jgi:protoporphyrin/coproporphyrin ferrochelatase